MKKAFSVAIVLLGTLIGVGFASGKEIVTFFAGFGIIGIIMAMIAGVIFAGIVYIEMNKDENNEVKVFDKIADKFFIICAFIVMSAMIAGVFDLDKNLGNNNYVLSIIMLILSFVLVVIGLKSIEKINKMFVPIIVALIAIIAIICCKSCKINKFNHKIAVFKPFGFMLMYVGMNVLTILPLVKMFKTKLSDAKGKKICSAIFGFGVAIILCVSVLLLLAYGDFESSMPMLKIAGLASPVLSGVYKGVIMLGLITTLISSAFVVRKEVDKLIKNKFVSTLLCFAGAFAVSIMGFAGIINVLYPIIGVLGIVYIAYEFIGRIFKMRK